jgi:hypothetical protein
MLPATGDPLIESLMASSMGAGVLVGLLIAEAALPTGEGRIPDCPRTTSRLPPHESVVSPPTLRHRTDAARARAA